MINNIVIAILLSLSLTSCGGGGGSSPPPPTTYDAFGAPELVEIGGYSGVLAEDNVMEPFFSRDEQYLFFNDNAPGGKNLHYATYNGTDFNYGGEIVPGINDASSVQGVPTMDASDNFYFIDTKLYTPGDSSAIPPIPPFFITIFTGNWTGSSVTGVTPVIGLDFPSPGFLNFDLEVSLDGQTIWFNDGFFSGNPFPEAADIKYATFVSPGEFIRAPDADTIMANINTTEDLEYAPAISTDGLELFFTRLDLDTMDARIYRAIRPDTNSAFGTSLLVSAIPGFSEGATFSQDEKTIYFHWFNPGTNKFELYRVTRP